jgi:flagellar biogenesis protein FliO
VVLVDVAGKVLVLGVTPGRITPCTPSTPPTCPARRTTPAPAGKDFQSWLKQTLERRSR